MKYQGLRWEEKSKSGLEASLRRMVSVRLAVELQYRRLPQGKFRVLVILEQGLT